jgi:hypothetical protein
MRLVRITSKWISLIGFGALIGVACFSVFPNFFLFLISLGGSNVGTWSLGLAHVLAPGFLAAISLSALHILRRHPAFYPLGAVFVAMLWVLALKMAPVAKMVFPLS